MNKLTLVIVIMAAGIVFNSCSSLAKETMKHGTGTLLGTVSATATLIKTHAGKITGDTQKYGYFDRMGALERELKGIRRSNISQEKNSSGPTLAEKAYAVAAYEIIQQVKAKGGNAVANVINGVEKNYDPAARIETVTVSITADAIKR